MTSAGSKRVIILAGPNGAGKTTFAREFLPNEAACPAFVNADLIAAGLSPFEPERAAIRAGRLMIELMDAHAARGEDFAFETTLASRGYLRSIGRWRAAGYHVSLHFLMLPSVEFALGRVAQRVAQGGHAIPAEVVRRRFVRGLDNFQTHYRHRVDRWFSYDATGDAPVLVDRGEGT